MCSLSRSRIDDHFGVGYGSAEFSENGSDPFPIKDVVFLRGHIKTKNLIRPQCGRQAEVAEISVRDPALNGSRVTKHIIYLDAREINHGFGDREFLIMK